MSVFAWTVFGFAALPLLLGLTNVMILRAPKRGPGGRPNVSILIPARNEELRLGPVLAAARASEDVDLEIIIADDHSTDGTCALVEAAIAEDPRVRLETPPPPDVLAGKMNACAHLAEVAAGDVLLFIDADVILAPDAARRIADRIGAGYGLVSGFPRQATETPWERVLIPLIYAVLMGYLPLIGAKLTRFAMFATGCGQLIAADRAAYEAVGGHRILGPRLHDGMILPAAFRKAGFRTELIDATPLADCRMYESFSEIWRGFSKNATEAMATPVGLPVWTTLLGLGHVAPVFLAALAAFGLAPAVPAFGSLGAVLAYRTLITLKFRQDPRAIPSHPLGVAMLLWLQWRAFFDAKAGKRVAWKGREYQPQ